ncbi:MAG: hypothetical protein M3Y86_09380 [Verrucomicrobiota bacterium]|nr:hypothetical protein [Verrucomicrobiota bacterium]
MNSFLSKLRAKTAAISAPRAQRLELLAALGLTAALALMHVVLLFNRGPLWRDEICSLALATQPTWGGFWNSLALDPCPPFFFVLLRGWAAMVGHADFALRLLGFLIGLACLAAFWMSARLVGRRTPLLCLLLLGMSPNMVIWGDSLRGYGCGIFWIVLAFGFFWRLAERPTPLVVLGAIAVSLGSVHSLYTNSLLIFACAMAAAVVCLRRGQLARAALIMSVGAVTALSLLPYLPLFYKTAEWAAFSRINFTFFESFWMLGFALLGVRYFAFWLWLVLIIAGLGTAWRMQLRKQAATAPAATRDLSFYVLLAAGLGFAATMIFFRLVGWGTNVWYYLPMLALVALSADSSLDLSGHWKLWPLARVATAAVGIAFSAPLLFKATEIRATNIDFVADVIAKHATPNDLVIIWPSADGVTFQRYYQSPNKWLTVPQAAHIPALPGDDIIAPFRQPNSLKPIVDQISATLQNGGRVWLASTWPLELPPEGRLRPVAPLDDQHPHSVSYFLRGWGYILAAEFRTHAAKCSYIPLPEDQPVSVYEHSHILLFSGWKEARQAAR